MRTIGDELISSDTVAILELVKNAYDADAKFVLIRFDGVTAGGKGAIEVVDDGVGMATSILTGAWLEPASSNKRRESRSPTLGRRVLGEKGIGRFASSRVGSLVEVVSRTEGADHETSVLVDWSAFASDDAYLDEVEVEWQVNVPTVFCEGSSENELWRSAFPDAPLLRRGTELRMEALRGAWDERLIRDLRTALERLVSPTLGESNSDFRIALALPKSLESLAGNIEPPQFVSDAPYSLDIEIAHDGSYTGSAKSSDGRVELSGQIQVTDGMSLKCGGFSLALRAWDLDGTGLEPFASQAGMKLSQMRRAIKDVAGISIYRDGFRVLPYGETDDDWLRLDARRVNNPTLRLSNNQLSGHLMISGDRNPGLRDQSNREGLIEGAALDDLRCTVLESISILELRRHRSRRTEPEVHSEDSGAGIFGSFALDKLKASLLARHPNDDQLREQLESAERQFQDGIDKVQAVLSRYQRLATLGTLVDYVLHEGRAPLGKIMQLSRIHLQRNSTNPVVAQAFQRIGDQSDVLSKVFFRIEPFSGKRRGKPSTVVVEEVISRSVDVLSSELQRAGIEVTLPTTRTEARLDDGEVQQILVNLLTNAAHWLQQVPRGARKIVLQAARTTDLSAIEITVSDSGPGVKAELQDLIFQPYVSGRQDGVGLGLSIVGDIATDYYGGKAELITNGPLPGATFKVTLGRRI